MEEAQGFNRFARLAGLEEVIHLPVVDPASLIHQLRWILSSMRIPEGVIATGLEDFAAGLEQLGEAA